MDRIANRERLFIIVELPPQHGKSTFITETFPAYFLCKNPDKLAMVVSYSEELYKKFGRKNREKFRLYSDELFDLKLSSETASVSEWGIDNHLGQLYSTSILGGATGRGSDLLIIDDPVKNRAEAESKTMRDKIYSEWRDTFYSRLSANGSVIIIMTRWHEDDLAGRLLKEKTLIYIGESSYSIYLNHTIIMFVVPLILFLINGVIVVDNAPVALLILALTSLIISSVSFLSFKNIEEPFLRKK